MKKFVAIDIAKSYSRRSAGILVLVGVLAGVTVGGGVGVIAASTSKSETVCVDKNDQHMNYSNSGKCKSHQIKLVLNQTGAKGDTGAAGAKGDTSVAGAAGAAGAKGDTGAAGAKGDTGAAGTKGTNGTNATLAITQQSVCDGSDADTVANELCKVGMTGPGGGLIFFVDYDNEYASYDYLEAAPADGVFASSDEFTPSDGVFASSETTGVWATTVLQCGAVAPQVTDCQAATIYTATGVTLATIKGLHRGLFGGKAATAAIVARHDAGVVDKNLYAAGVADDYVVNGKTDWWLPSRNELAKMQENLNEKGVGGFALGFYWSSSEGGANDAWAQAFGPGTQYANSKTATAMSYVRPVRAF